MGVTLSINEIKIVTAEMARYKSLDYTGYSYSFLKRRLGHVFDKLKIRRLPQFSERLTDETFRESVKYYMAVNVTEMFRDPAFWRALRKDVFPLFNGNNWSAWLPDTPSGEEVYSLLVLLQEEELLDRVDVLCQHPSKEKCREISEGVIDQGNIDISYSNYKRLEENDCFDNYFTETGDGRFLRKDLLKNCRFRNSWFGDEEPDENFDLILFRNSGINYTARKKEENFGTILERLKPGGVIALGVRETVPILFRDQLGVLNEKESIFFRKP
ncbi:MAG: chemotaxis protein methyltransferase CheR [Anaerophaga sp.]|nr:chemotaxis protein methyltransferase CheR [Anaerophaga sp.]